MINLTINGKALAVPDGTTILEAAKDNGINIPHLCYLKDVHQSGACRMCVVEVEGMKNLQASCISQAKEGMVIHTNTGRVRNARKVLFELLMSDHPKDCLICSRNNHCEIQDLGEQIQVQNSRFEGSKSKSSLDNSSWAIEKDDSKCILCKRCVTVCNEIQGVGILNTQNRGFEATVAGGLDLPLGETVCTNCGQCVTVCPTGALKERDAITPVWDAIMDPKKVVVVQTAPAVRVALGEEFDMEPGSNVTGKMAKALEELGFDHVFDTNFAADLTIIEEGTELLVRLVNHLFHQGAIDEEAVKKTGLPLLAEPPALPMITSCSPGWIKYAEHAFPQQLEHLSTCKSPHMMLGALIKTYYASVIKVRPEDLYVVSIMPCTAKKYEIKRPEMVNDDLPNVDAVLTTRELGKMIKDAGIDFVALEEGEFENPLGLSSGAADIFGVTGGVMEAALRTVYELVTGREIPFEKLRVEPMKGLDRIKVASLTIEDPLEAFEFLQGVPVSIASTSGLVGATMLLDEIQQGTSPHLFIEVMGCPGGCISGGGQPRMTTDEIRQKRMEGLYREDEKKVLRKSHENPFIEQIYSNFLEKPLGHRSHELLHTNYTMRNKT
ncbi:iron hydrogenase small subunit [Alkalibacter rhizosphaerae]|uniref:Iron hydrogenase small subunit n=1 Tax=Alkalibacter rhizosphaerae TaxID=2815577 RepID=A0A974XHX2_9FIRM|nr:NADH-dependent [FeFe] hydrogenase, group A6 [Alkalibacter rhizosphaerae]QSX09045.1 iron hydrogenase small subunit [Alkalibacter rhizosphaerae]